MLYIILKNAKGEGFWRVEDNHTEPHISLDETVEDNTNLEYQDHAICAIRIVNCQSDAPNIPIPVYRS